MNLARRQMNTEFNYSNIEKEALVIVWTTTRNRQFLIGKKFLFWSDHRPLYFIFNPRKGLPKVTTSRILRWAIRLITFNFDIEYVNGNSILHRDAMSRLQFLRRQKIKQKKNLMILFYFGRYWCFVFFDRMASETRHDPVLSRIASIIRKKLFQGRKTLQRNKT